MDKSTKDIEAFDPINLCHVGWRRFTLCSGHTEVDAAGSVLRRTGRGGSPRRLRHRQDDRLDVRGRERRVGDGPASTQRRRALAAGARWTPPACRRRV